MRGLGDRKVLWKSFMSSISPSPSSKKRDLAKVETWWNAIGAVRDIEKGGDITATTAK